MPAPRRAGHEESAAQMVGPDIKFCGSQRYTGVALALAPYTRARTHTRVQQWHTRL